MRGQDSVDVIRVLLEKESANINVQDEASGQTPLMAAVLSGKPKIVEFLLEKGADVTIGEKDGYTPSHGAGFQGRAQIIGFLHQHGIDVVRDFHADGYAPLHRACWGREQRHADTVEHLLEVGADPNLPSKIGRTCADMTTNPATQRILEKHGVRLRTETEL